MYTISCFKKAWLLMSMLQVFSLSPMPTPSVQSSTPRAIACQASIPAAQAMLTCGATFIPDDAFPNCLSVSIAIAACDATPDVVVHGCLPSGDLVVLGTIEVRDADGVLHALWELRCVDGTVLVELIDIN
jgi:hypothetical protein